MIYGEVGLLLQVLAPLRAFHANPSRESIPQLRFSEIYGPEKRHFTSFSVPKQK